MLQLLTGNWALILMVVSNILVLLLAVAKFGKVIAKITPTTKDDAFFEKMDAKVHNIKEKLDKILPDKRD